MSRIRAVAWHTYREALRIRVVPPFIILLFVFVILLRFTLRGDDTVAGKLQNYLAYSLGALSVFAACTTAFFACHTLASEIKNNELHMVVTKPVSRFELLVGKWLGINLLNLVVVALGGAIIFAGAVSIRDLPEKFARDRLKVRDVVWTARSASRAVAPNFDAQVAEYLAEQVRSGRFAADSRDAALAGEQRRKELINKFWRVERGTDEVYRFDNLPRPEREDSAIQVRFRIRGTPMPANEIVHAWWLFIDADSGQPLMPAPHHTNGRSGDMLEFLVNAPAVIKNGKAALVVMNYGPEGPGEVDFFFEGDDGLEILYKVDSFESNYLKTLAMTLFRLSFLAAVGLTFSVFVSFPIACLCTFVAYVVGLGWSWWWEAMGFNLQVYTPDVDPYGAIGPFVREMLRFVLVFLFPNFVRFDGTQKLVAGENIAPELLAQCALHTTAFGAALLMIFGWYVFSRREVAEVQV